MLGELLNAPDGAGVPLEVVGLDPVDRLVAPLHALAAASGEALVGRSRLSFLSLPEIAGRAIVAEKGLLQPGDEELLRWPTLLVLIELVAADGTQFRRAISGNAERLLWASVADGAYRIERVSTLRWLCEQAGLQCAGRWRSDASKERDAAVVGITVARLQGHHAVGGGRVIAVPVSLADLDPEIDLGDEVAALVADGFHGILSESDATRATFQLADEPVEDLADDAAERVIAALDGALWTLAIDGTGWGTTYLSGSNGTLVMTATDDTSTALSPWPSGLLGGLAVTLQDAHLAHPSDALVVALTAGPVTDGTDRDPSLFLHLLPEGSMGWRMRDHMTGEHSATVFTPDDLVSGVASFLLETGSEVLEAAIGEHLGARQVPNSVSPSSPR